MLSCIKFSTQDLISFGGSQFELRPSNFAGGGNMATMSLCTRFLLTCRGLHVADRTPRVRILQTPIRHQIVYTHTHTPDSLRGSDGQKLTKKLATNSSTIFLVTPIV